MKTATIPSLRVDPKLRKAAERVLRDGESLSGFVEQSLRAQIASREAQSEFVARGLAARNESRTTGKYYPAGKVLRELDGILAQAQSAAKKKS
jgi:predicted transcriptional regulator